MVWADGCHVEITSERRSNLRWRVLRGRANIPIARFSVRREFIIRIRNASFPKCDFFYPIPLKARPEGGTYIRPQIRIANSSCSCRSIGSASRASETILGIEWVRVPGKGGMQGPTFWGMFLRSNTKSIFRLFLVPFARTYFIRQGGLLRGRKFGILLFIRA